MEKETSTEREAKDVLHDAFAKASDSTKKEIIKALGEIGGLSAIESIVAIALDTTELDLTRDLAISTLGLLGPDAIDELINALKSSDEKRTQEAERALSVIGSPAVSRLIVALKDFDTRDHPEKALSQMRPPPVNALKDAFEKNDKNEKVLKRIIRGLELIGDDATQDFLKNIALQNEKFSEDVRLEAVKALYQIAKDLEKQIEAKKDRTELTRDKLLLMLDLSVRDPVRHQAWRYYADMLEYLDSIGTDIGKLEGFLKREDTLQTTETHLRQVIRDKIVEVHKDMETLEHVKAVVEKCHAGTSQFLFQARMPILHEIKVKCDNLLT